MIPTWVAWAVGFLGLVFGASTAYRTALAKWSRSEYSYARRIKAGHLVVRHPVVLPEKYPPNRGPWRPMLSCPFCGSTSIDPEGWMSPTKSGPACDDCGGSAETIALWNGDRSELDTHALKNHQTTRRA